MKELITKDYIIWIFLRMLSNGLVVVSIFFFINEKESNIYFSILLFILSIPAYIFYYRISPRPKFATCLENRSNFVKIYTNIALNVGFGFFLLVVFLGLEGSVSELYPNIGILFTIFLSGLALYIYSCKKNRIIKK